MNTYSVTSSPCVVRVLSAPVIKDVTFSNQTYGFSFDTIRFRSDAVPGMTNIIEYRDDLGTNSPSSWTPLLSTVGDGNTFHFSVTNAPATPLAPRRFYRVRVE